MRFAVCLPLLDDWDSVAELLRRLDAALPREHAFEVLLVDDGSARSAPAALMTERRVALGRTSVLRLRRNMGHQRAIGIGLCHIYKHVPCDGVLVMDADGEDTPEGASRLVREFVEHRGEVAVFAQRVRRTESLGFRLGYAGYRLVHRLLLGRGISVSNFSLIPRRQLSALVVVEDVWNHYAAAQFKTGLPRSLVPIDRGFRIAGRSRMNLTTLVIHGLSAISVFADVVGVRLLLHGLIIGLLALAGALAVIGIRVFTDLAVPGWATVATAAFVIVFLQAMMLSLIFSFIVLGSRSHVSVIPIRDYHYFVAEEPGPPAAPGLST